MQNVRNPFKFRKISDNEILSEKVILKILFFFIEKQTKSESLVCFDCTISPIRILFCNLKAFGTNISSISSISNIP
jgi:hypothetical protein